MIQIQEASPLKVREVISKSEFAGVAGAENTLRECLYRSTVRMAAYIDDEPACMWGLAPQSLLSNQAYIWLLTTDIAAGHKFLLVRYSQIFVQRALENYEMLTGHCEAGNLAAKRWLKWLGAEFGEGDGKRVPFVIRRK
jgi:hypothetical protein